MSTITTTRSSFFVPIPVDEHLNTGYPQQVIEAQPLRPNKWGVVMLKVLAPDSFAKSWPTVHKDEFTRCSGPVRTLNNNDYAKLVSPLIDLHPIVIEGKLHFLPPTLKRGY